MGISCSVRQPSGSSRARAPESSHRGRSLQRMRRALTDLAQATARREHDCSQDADETPLRKRPRREPSLTELRGVGFRTWDAASALEVEARAVALEGSAAAERGSPHYNSTTLQELQTIAAAIPLAVQEATGHSACCGHVSVLVDPPSAGEVLGFARCAKKIVRSFMRWQKAVRLRQAQRLQDEMDDFVEQGLWEQALATGMRRADLLQRHGDVHRWRWAVVHIARICLATLRIDEAEDAAQRLVAFGHADDNSAAQGWLADQARLIRTHAAQSRGAGLYHMCPVQILDNSQQPELVGMTGKIRGKSLWLRSGLSALVAPPPLEDDMFDVVIGSAHASIHASHLCAITVVLQIREVVEHDHGVRVVCRTMGGVDVTGSCETLGELSAASVRAGAADAVSMPACAIRCTLPDGTLVGDGAAGDAALRACAVSADSRCARERSPPPAEAAGDGGSTGVC